MLKFIKKNLVAVLANVVLLLIVISTVMVVRSRKIMLEKAHQQEVIETTLTRAGLILNNLQAIDLGLRAYVITRGENHYNHFKSATTGTTSTFSDLEVLLAKQGYQSKTLPALKEAMNNYISYCNEIVNTVSNGEDSLAREMIIKDKGYDVWKLHKEFYEGLSDYEKSLSAKAKQEYDSALSGSIWMMVILLLISIPSIYYIVHIIRVTEKKRIKMFKELEENNRKFNFNPGFEICISNEYEVVSEYINNSKKAADFVNKITEGNYEVHWEGLNEENHTLNEENLAGALVRMKNQMKSVKEEEEKRQWVTKGQAQFSEVIRNHQENLKDLALESLKFIVKYFQAQQGGLFLVQEDNDKNKYLELASCYAFERKKFVNKKIEIGEGLLGQAYLEAQTIMLREIPQGYALIKSGLGDTTPNCLLIVPMKYNDEVHAIIELAGFVIYEPYQVEFLEKLGEFVASAVFTAQTNEVTKNLLVEAQSMTEEMKAQEEEVRQNMEELTATQEEMYRKEKEYIERINELEGKVAELEKKSA